MADPAPGPDSPLSELGASAVQLHELYTSFVVAGFTEAQAMELVCTLLSTMVSGA